MRGSGGSVASGGRQTARPRSLTANDRSEHMAVSRNGAPRAGLFASTYNENIGTMLRAGVPVEGLLSGDARARGTLRLWQMVPLNILVSVSRSSVVSYRVLTSDDVGRSCLRGLPIQSQLCP
ncbi:hypothetical protein FRB94_003852 [Tulasnella sp. JGI-2019a]|nr:hypothetical protein FRB94_003852 [Tulasnella sp. JGI-2019a]